MISELYLIAITQTQEPPSQRQWRTGGGRFGSFKVLPPPTKLRSFDKVEPDCEFERKMFSVPIPTC